MIQMNNLHTHLARNAGCEPLNASCAGVRAAVTAADRTTDPSPSELAAPDGPIGEGDRRGGLLIRPDWVL